MITAAGWGLFFFRPAWFPVAITAAGHGWDDQFSRTLWIAGLIFAAVQIALVLVILIRKRPPEKRDRAWPEYLWTGATAALFLYLAVSGSRGWASVPTI